VPRAVRWWNRSYRYKLDNCVFYANSAFSGGVLYILGGQDEDGDNANYTGSDGTVTVARCGNGGISHENRAIASERLRFVVAERMNSKMPAMPSAD